MSTLAELFPAGAGKEVNFTASGAISAAGKPVILNSTGTVTEVGGAAGSAGTPVSFGSVGTPNYVNVVYDTNANKVVVFWLDYGNSQYGTAAVGTVSGMSLSWGTAVVFNSAGSSWISATFDSDANKTVTAYQDAGNSSYGTAIVGTVSGTSISFGTEANFNAANTTNIGIGFDSTANKVVVAFRDDGNSDYGTAVVGTVSGTGISFGSEAVFQTNQTSSHNLAHDPDENKMVLVYKHDGNSSYGTANVCTITGTNIAFGTDSIFKTANTSNTTVVYDTSANKVIVPYSISGAGKGVVGTVSGTGITFGAEAEFNAGGSSNIACAYDSNANKTVVSYTEAVTTFDGFAVAGTVSGTSISFGTALNFTGDVTYSSSGQNTIYDPDENKMVSAYRGAGSVVYTADTRNLTSTNLLGISKAAISNAASGTIVLKGGLVTTLSGLTPSATYYVQNDGSLTSPDATYPYSIDGAAYDSVSLDVSSQESSATGMCFNDDGTKMYVVGEGSDAIFQYSLSSAYDLSTASYDSVSLSVSSQQSHPRSVVFNNDGSALYISGTSSSAAHQYTLSAAYDLSTGSYASKTVSLSSQELYPCGLIFNNDGTSMYIVGSGSDTVYQYTLSTAFDVSTASYASKSMSVSSEQTSPTGLAFNSDGTKIFVSGESPGINQYSLTSAYDISTGSYDSVSYGVSHNARGIVWGNSGLKFYIPDSDTDTIYQYTAGGGPTSSVKLGRALSATTLDLEYQS